MAILTTRKTIRRRVGRQTGDMLLCIATAAGSTTTFVDTLNLNVEGSILLGRHGVFSGGTADNLNRIVRVTANVKANQTLTFTPTTATATATNDELELWNQRGEGTSPSVINDLIDDAISDLAENAPIPVTSDTFTFSSTNPIIDIDTLLLNAVANGSSWEAITGVDWRPISSDDDFTYSWRKVDSVDLDVDRDGRTITIKGRHSMLADQNSMRVRGANTSGSLSSDSDTTQINAEWLMYEVSARALAIRMEKAYDRKELDITRAGFQMQADVRRPRTALRLRGRYWRLT